ncbi:MAG TPA: NHL repeat-containing protein [Planctomycetota bacterium]|nr:NHL repeat-containing protein [Planctomycetota bacterium]
MRMLLAACLCVSLLPHAQAQLLQGGRLAVGCDGDGKVHVFGAGGNPQGQAPLAPAVAQQPRDVVFGPDGRTYVVSSGTHEVLVLDAEGGKLDAFPLAEDSSAAALAFGPDGLLWVLDDEHDELLRFDTVGIPKPSVDVPAGSYPEAGLAFGADGRVLLSNQSADTVLELDPATGAVIRELGAGQLSAPRGLAVAPDGSLHVCEADHIVVLDADGNVADTLADASFEDLRGLAFGPDGKLYVADAGADKVHVLSDGQVSDHVGGATLDDPVCVAFAPHRFKATLKGTLARAGQPLSKVKETSVVITLLPGSRTMMLALTDDVTEDSDLSSVFGASYLVFRGFEAAEDDGAKVRLWQGTQVEGPAAAGGLASLSLQVNGSMKQGQFVPKKGKGTLLRDGAAGAYSATVKVGKAEK